MSERETPSLTIPVLRHLSTGSHQSEYPPRSTKIEFRRYRRASTPERRTAHGEVFRADRSGTTWTATRIDDIAAGPLGLQGLVSDLAVDWADAGLLSIYLVFGGMGDARHVWHFDGTRWEPRSGAPGSMTNLLDVEHNALVVDRTTANHIYVGADIGVWHSADSGATWEPLSNGLPDAPVFDLQIHPTQRLLRAATHGRGVYELAL